MAWDCHVGQKPARLTSDTGIRQKNKVISLLCICCYCIKVDPEAPFVEVSLILTVPITRSYATQGTDRTSAPTYAAVCVAEWHYGRKKPSVKFVEGESVIACPSHLREPETRR